jgi:hypothetical protein
MSEQDHKPYHAKGAAPGQEAADVVAEVLKHAAEREQASKVQQRPKGPPKWMLPLTLNLGVLALYFLIAQPDFLIVSPVEDPRPSGQVLQQERQGIYFDGIMRIDMFRAQNGRLPRTLEEAGITLGQQGVEYSTQGDSSYILIKTIGTESIVFDSRTDSAAEWLGTVNLPG